MLIVESCHVSAIVARFLDDGTMDSTKRRITNRRGFSRFFDQKNGFASEPEEAEIVEGRVSEGNAIKTEQ